MIHLDYKDSRPIYEQVADRLKELMILGVLEEDGQMPSVRSLATELSINPNTIQRAYAELERNGFIYSVKGQGKLCGKHQQTPGTEMPGARREGSRSCGGGKSLGMDKTAFVRMAEEQFGGEKQYDRGNQSHKKFDDILAVDHINAQIREGSVFGLIGTNGAGKSTFCGWRQAS